MKYTKNKVILKPRLNKPRLNKPRLNKPRLNKPRLYSPSLNLLAMAYCALKLNPGYKNTTLKMQLLFTDGNHQSLRL